MLGLDQYAPFLLSALGITVVVLGAYGLYLRSRLNALRTMAARGQGSRADPPPPFAAPRASSLRAP